MNMLMLNRSYGANVLGTAENLLKDARSVGLNWPGRQGCASSSITSRSANFPAALRQFDSHFTGKFQNQRRLCGVLRLDAAFRSLLKIPLSRQSSTGESQSCDKSQHSK